MFDSNLIPGLKLALSILESRVATAKALKYNEAYLGAMSDLEIFLKAEIWRQENPEEAKNNQIICD